MMLLKEYLNPNTAHVSNFKQTKTGELYMSGIMMQGEILNGNGRKYPLSEIKRAVENCAAQISAGHPVMGELNHPNTLSIDLNNVSHAITEISLSNNNAVGKMKILNTPKGMIAKAIMEGGIKLGVSSRGSGDVDNYGVVSNFLFLTMDIVSTPSAPNAFPDPIYEALNNTKVISLAEAVVNDKAAQKYFTLEINKLIESITKGK